MNKLKTYTLILAVILGSLSTLTAANPSASASVDVELVSTLSISKNTDMHFGRVALNGNGAGVLVLGVDGTVQTTNLFMAQAGSSITPTAAVFSVDGINDANYTVLLPTSAVLLTKVGSTETMSVSDFTAKLATKEVGNLSGSVSADKSFAVGATLRIPQTQPEGRYQGTFSVSISYN